MDFSSAGVTEQVDGAFRAHVQRSDKGSTGRHIYGPRRPDEAAAKEDLESLRAAASGMSREDGFAAMKAEADELKAGKPPKEVGFIDRDGKAFRVQFCLVMYPSGLWAPGASWAVFWAPGASWIGFWALLGAKYLRGDGAPSGQVIINTKF